MSEKEQLESTRQFLTNSIQQFSEEIQKGEAKGLYGNATGAAATEANAHRIAQYSSLLEKVIQKIEEK